MTSVAAPAAFNLAGVVLFLGFIGVCAFVGIIGVLDYTSRARHRRPRLWWNRHG